MGNQTTLGDSAKKVTRRKLTGAIAAGAALTGFPMINVGRYALFAQPFYEYSTRAIDLIGESFVFDLKHALHLHPEILRRWFHEPESFGEKEWQRFRSTGLTGMQTTVEWHEDVLLDYAMHNSFIATHNHYFTRIDSVESLESIQGSGQIGIMLGSENSEHFHTLEDVDQFYALGQRISQLTYNSQNRLGSGATDRVDGGLSDYGATIIERMNDIGMLVDVSHCGEATTLDGIEFSVNPVIISHATCRALVPNHPRTKTDEAIKLMAKKGGIMGIAFLRVFVRDREPTTVEHALDHIDHMVKLVGVEHVAVGSDIDLDGYDDLPREWVEKSKANLKPGTYQFRDKDDVDGLNHPRRMFDLAEGLIRRGYIDDDIRLILGGNVKRVLTQVWNP